MAAMVAVELPEKQGLKLKEHELQPADKLSCCSGTSRKTRIETSITSGVGFGIFVVAVELPEKQGLKQNVDETGVDTPLKSCSGTSRKTRIETTS